MTFLASTAVAALSLVNVTPDNLGYAGVMLGDSRAVVEWKLRRRLPPIVDHDIPACGNYQSTTYIGGHEVVIQWADRTPRGIVQSIIVSIERRGALPGGLVRDGDAFYPRKSRKAVLFFSGEDEPPLLYLYDPECTD